MALLILTHQILNIKGDLQYFAVAHSYSDFIKEYNYDKGPFMSRIKYSIRS
jgi:hypothetical protein